VHIFGQKASRGAFLVTLVLCGCAELDTMNLWAGIDASAEA